MTNTNVNNNANTNVNNNANTNVNNNANTNNENNYMNGELAIGFDELVMVGEELLRVVRSNATTYHIYDTTIQSVTPFIQQVIGDCKCNMHEKVGYEVNVVTVEVYVSISGIFDGWLYEGVTGWDQTFQIRDKLEVMGIFLPAVEVERQYALWMKGFEAADTTDYFCVDNTEGDEMLTNVVQQSKKAVTSNTNVMEKQVMRKSEQLIAESVIPMLFANMMVGAIYNEKAIAAKQVIAASMFKTMYYLVDSAVTVDTFCDEYHQSLSYFLTRNRDKVTAEELLMEDENYTVALTILTDLGFMEDVLGSGVYTVSQKFVDMCSVSEKTAPLTTMIDDNNRRVFKIKGNKVQPSKLMNKAMAYLERTGFSNDVDMTAIVNIVKSQHPKLDIWKDIKGSMNGINGMHSDAVYYSEQKGDKRGRMYHVAHAGCNPQGDDYNRSIYRLAAESIVKIDSPEYVYFMNELEEAAGKDPKYMATEYLMRVGKSPVKALSTFLQSKSVDSPFMYVRLARDFVKFQEHGECDVRVPMGLDAKCSGTQILAILAGNKELMKATGFTPKKVFDPYALCAIQMDMAGIDRNAMKTPYMAIQYGGGEAALIGQKDYMAVMAAAGVDDPTEAAKLTINAVKRVLGKKIIGLQEYIAEQVAGIMLRTGKANVVYKHIDGQIVDLKVCGKVKITDGFTSIRYTQNTIISFGSQVNDTGMTVSDGVPCADEYSRTFMVNYIQGIDALIARTVASLAEDAGIEGYVSIHDCFRTSLKDTPKLKALICRAYEIIFVENDPIAHLCEQLGIDMPAVSRELTSEMIYMPEAYFFC